jgi:hypothetical protein
LNGVKNEQIIPDAGGNLPEPFSLAAHGHELLV